MIACASSTLILPTVTGNSLGRRRYRPTALRPVKCTLPRLPPGPAGRGYTVRARVPDSSNGIAQAPVRC